MLLLNLTRNFPHHLRLHALLLSSHAAWHAQNTQKQLRKEGKRLDKQAFTPIPSQQEHTQCSTRSTDNVFPSTTPTHSSDTDSRAQAGCTKQVNGSKEEAQIQKGSAGSAGESSSSCSVVGHMVLNGACHSLLEGAGQLQLLQQISEDLARHSHCYTQTATTHATAPDAKTCRPLASTQSHKDSATSVEGVGLMQKLSGHRLQQRGVVCVSSCDGPDDCNAVQYVLAQEFVRRELEGQGLLPAGCSLHKAYPEVRCQ